MARQGCSYGQPEWVISMSIPVVIRFLSVSTGYQSMCGPSAQRCMNCSLASHWRGRTHGAGVVACWVDVLGHLCFDAGHAASSRWSELLGFAKRHLGRRPRLASAPSWDVVAACLAWEPDRRCPMRRVLEMPWFTQPLAPAPSSATVDFHR